jgi:DNA-binding winged helix-turn-helix (wHTH) protein/TolB-like protein/Tfp pilus assembly protein PilF
MLTTGWACLFGSPKLVSARRLVNSGWGAILCSVSQLPSGREVNTSAPGEQALNARRQYVIGEFTLDLQSGFLRHGSQEVALRRQAFEVLAYLVERAGRLVTKTELLDAIWPDAAITDNSLAQCLLEVRRALGDDSQQMIRTVARRGYIFTAAITLPMIPVPAGLARVVRETPVELPEAPAKPSPADAWIPASISKVLSHKGLAAMLILLAIIGGGLIWYRGTGISAPVETLAVLPFKPVGSQSQDEYVQLGMTDALITKLSNVHRIIVRPTASIRKFATSQDPLAAGRELKVAAIVDGTVQRLNDRIRVNVQLLRVSDGRPLWADKFDENFNDVFSVQDSISERIATALLRHLTGEEEKQVNKRYTANAEAYQLYAKGRYSWEQRTEAGLKHAVFYFEQAIQKDPRFALAYAGLADCYGPLMQRSYMSALEALPKLEKAASTAVELDETLGEAHTALAAARMSDWDWPSTEREFKRAIELNPNDATAHLWYGFYLEAMGRQQENLGERKRAYELDPSNLTINAGLGWALFRAGQPAEAVAFLKRAIELNPNFAMSHENLGNVYVETGVFDQALEQFSKPEQLSARAYVLARAGDRARARENLDRVVSAPSSQRPGAEMGIAAAYAALGDREKAFSWLEAAYREHNPQLMFLKVDERFSTLRSETGFQDLLRRVRLL